MYLNILWFKYLIHHILCDQSKLCTITEFGIEVKSVGRLEC